MKLTDKRYVMPFVLITTLFFLWGFARSILDVLNKHFQNTIGMSNTESSFIQVTTYLGYFLMAIPAGWFITRYGYRRGVVMGLTVFGLGSLAFIPASSYEGFLAALFVIGCGLTFLETAANPYVTELGPVETASSRLNLSQTFNGMGCFMATFLVGGFFFGKHGGIDADVAVPYAVMGVLVLVIALIFTRVKLPEIAPDEHDDAAADDYFAYHDKSIMGGIRRVLRDRLFVFGLLALLAYEVAEISINSYFVIFTTHLEVRWLSAIEAKNVISLGLVIFMVGRFLGSWIMRRVRPELMLLGCGAGSVACMSLVVLDFGTVSLVALIANYLFEAIMFPTIFSLALQNLDSRDKKSASSLLMMTPIGGCGFMLMGWLADTTDPFIPFLLPLAGYSIVMFYALTMKYENELIKFRF